MSSGIYESTDGVEQNSIEAAALYTLEALGLVSLRATKARIGGRITEKGRRLLLHENPKLKFPISENTRWIITTIISVVALLTAIISLAVK